MNPIVATARILLGLVFLAAGLSGFLLINNPPPAPPGLAGAFQDVFFRSHWVLLVDGVEFVAGAVPLSNRFVPLALTLLGAVITNILTFHITMQPAGIIPGLVVTVLWTVVAFRFRSSLAPLFVARPEQGRPASAIPKLRVVERALAS